MANWQLCFRLALVLLLMQGVLWLLARGLGRRLEWRVVALGQLLPWLLLVPWLGRDAALLVPTDSLAVGHQLLLSSYERLDPDPYAVLSDTLLQFLPWELEVRHAFAAGRLPFWSDMIDGGSAVWSNPQAQVLAPIAMLARVVPIQHFLLVALALKLLVAFQGTWLLTRAVGTGRFPAFAAALGFALGGGIMAWALFPHSGVAAWAPWHALAVIQLFRRPGPRALVVAAAVTGFLLLSGHPEVALASGLFSALCGIWFRRAAAGLSRPLASAATAMVLGLGLAAPALLPFLYLMPTSQRYVEKVAEPVSLAAMEANPQSWFVDRRYAYFFVPTNPQAVGRPFVDEISGLYNWCEAEPGYAGLLSLAGLFLVLASRRRRFAMPFVLFLLVSTLLASKPVPLLALLGLVPPLQVPAYERFLLVATLALCVAGGLGLEAVRRRWGPLLPLSVAVAAVVSLGVAMDTLIVGLWALLFAGVLLARRWPRPALLLLTMVLLVDLFPWARRMLPRGEPNYFYPRTAAIERIAAELSSAGGPWRVVGEDLEAYPGQLSVHGFSDVRPHNPLATMEYLSTLTTVFDFAPATTRYFARFHGPEHPFLDFLNVRVVVSNYTQPAKDRLARLDSGELGDHWLYRNPDALPRWFLPTAADVIRRDEIDGWLRSLSDARTVALFDDESSGWRPETRGWNPAAVTSLSAAPGRITLELPRDGEKLLATSIPLLPGWRATGGGEPLRIRTVNGAFVGVRVPNGVGQVELRYRPQGLALGLFWCLLSLLVLGWFLCLTWRRAGSRRD